MIGWCATKSSTRETIFHEEAALEGNKRYSKRETKRDTSSNWATGRPSSENRDKIPSNAKEESSEVAKRSSNTARQRVSQAHPA